MLQKADLPVHVGKANCACTTKAFQIVHVAYLAIEEIFSIDIVNDKPQLSGTLSTKRE